MKYFLNRLAAVSVAQWVQLNGGRYGPLIPGDDTHLECTYSDTDQVVLFLIEAEPALNVRWGSTDEAVFVEYAAPATRQLNQRRVVLKRDETEDYLCFLAWVLVHWSGCQKSLALKHQKASSIPTAGSTFLAQAVGISLTSELPAPPPIRARSGLGSR